MRGEDFFKIIDGIDDDIILDIPELTAEKPTKVVIENKKTPIWAAALLAACFVLILVLGVFVAAKLQSNRIVGPSSYDPGTSDIESNLSSADSSDSSDSGSQSDEFVPDKDVLNNVRLVKGDTKLNLMNSTAGMECEELLHIFSYSQYSPGVKGLYADESGIAIWAKLEPYDHFFRLDNDNIEIDHVAFNINDPEDLIPNRVYPNGGYFSVTSEDGITELRYYKNGRLTSTAQLPKSYRASFTPDYSQYLYIDPDRSNLILHDLSTGAVIKSLSVKDLGYDERWEFVFVNAVTSKLATVTLLDTNPNTASEFSGSEELRSYLLELPTLRVIQQLPDGTELTAIDDENFIMTQKHGSDYRNVSRAALWNGELIEMDGQFLIDAASQYYNSSNIILSPSKKVMLVRFWNNNNNSRLVCMAYSTETMRQIWEIQLEGGETIPTGFYTPAAITDDAVMYMFGDTLNDEDDRPLYIIQKKDVPVQPEPPQQSDTPTGTGKYSVRGGLILSIDKEQFPGPLVYMGNGTQIDLDRFNDLIQSSDLYSLDCYCYGYETDKEMTDLQAEFILDLLLTASLTDRPPPDENENPSSGGPSWVKGYDKDGNILFEAICKDRFYVIFHDGTEYEFECNNFELKLWNIIT